MFWDVSSKVNGLYDLVGHTEPRPIAQWQTILGVDELEVSVRHVLQVDHHKSNIHNH